ncbi:MAG: tungsten formylmethanofuran dehydrogenase [Bacteroidetes bacterium]|nr:MAG: tungsten formylmethanofuran dehydrogenase [Bacteroidota bacterium]
MSNRKTTNVIEKGVDKSVLKKAFRLMATAKSMTELYDANFDEVKKYVHATSRGHEAIQIAVGLQLNPQDFVAPYYRDEALLLSIGLTPYDLMLQLLAKKEDRFSAGRLYYGHPSLRDDDKPKIPTQTSATGMQAIPTTGVAMGMQYKETRDIDQHPDEEKPVAVCCFGDASITEGEVSEAFQMAALKQLPILYLVEDNGWDISASAKEFRANDASEYIEGFHGIEGIKVNGSDFVACYEAVEYALNVIRTERRPILLHAVVPLLNHHTSGVRMNWYRDDLEEHRSRDPYPILREVLRMHDFSDKQLVKIEKECEKLVAVDLDRARQAEDPKPEDLFTHDFAPTPITEEAGERRPADGVEKVMVDCALFAIQEIMEENINCVFYGQDVGGRLGGVFREAATLAQKFGHDRVFNTPIQEAFIIGSTVGMSAVGLKPIVEVQFADYIWPGLNQLFTEVSRSCYLSNGKWPVSMILRVPIGAYGSGGPYHSSSVESVVCNIRGIKVVYPSNGADLKGLMKAAYYDPNPVVMFEHKGLYWSKIPGTEAAGNIEPDSDYVIPLGKGRIVLETEANPDDATVAIVTYGMGVHWAFGAAKKFPGRVEVLDLRTLHPLDKDLMFEVARRNNRVLVVTEEPVSNSFAQSLAAMIQENCFEDLDAPVRVIGAEDMPAIPLNNTLERTMIPSEAKVGEMVDWLLSY